MELIAFVLALKHPETSIVRSYSELIISSIEREQLRSIFYRIHVLNIIGFRF